MNIAVFSSKAYDRRFLKLANANKHELSFYEDGLGAHTVKLAAGCRAVCCFVNDRLDAGVLSALESQGVRLIALRCAGFNNVDLKTAQKLNLTVSRVPAYSPFAVAEHAVALILALNRKTHRAYNRVRESNFALDGLLGFDLNGKTVGVIGTGRIGLVFARIMLGFGCKVLGHDRFPSPELEKMGGTYAPLEEVLSAAEILSLHCPLTPETDHLINARTIAQMKPGVMVINTGRGKLVETAAAIEALKTGQLGSLGLDVYEEEEKLFFSDHSHEILQDDLFARLMTFPNVIVTGHQAFFTKEALENIAATTLQNINAFDAGKPSGNELKA